MFDTRSSTKQPEGAERRRHHRYVVPMHVKAVRRDTHETDRQAAVIALLVRNISKSGLCCTSKIVLREDEELMLFIPSQGDRGGRDVRCHVTRCAPSESQYQIGLIFRDPMAEAASHLH